VVMDQSNTTLITSCIYLASTRYMKSEAKRKEMIMCFIEGEYKRRKKKDSSDYYKLSSVCISDSSP
ncbi:hypothetical protein, partial [Nesterenkonia halophila]